jgi:hypothetical protein
LAIKIFYMNFLYITNVYTAPNTSRFKKTSGGYSAFWRAFRFHFYSRTFELFTGPFGAHMYINSALKLLHMYNKYVKTQLKIFEANLGLTLIVPSEVKVELADFDVKLQEKLLCTLLYVNFK